MLTTNPSGHRDQAVTLAGTALDAQSGAVVMLSDRTPVYIADLPYWADEWFKKDIVVSGTLRFRSLAPDPSEDADGNQNPGMPGEDFVLENAVWKEADA